MLFSGQPGLRAVKRHPLTGEPIVPLGYRRDGRPIFPILGGAPDPDDDDEDDDDKPDDSGTGKPDGDDDGSPGGDDDDDSVSRADFNRLLRRMKAADKRAAALEQEKSEREKAEKTDLENAQGEVETLKKELQEAQSAISQLTLENAFLTANKHTWHDPDTALNIARAKKYLDDVVDEDSGDVDKVAMGKALDRLAKDHAYLVKTEEKKAADDEDAGPSGESSSSRSNNSKDDAAKKQKLHSRFPSLNR